MSKYNTVSGRWTLGLLLALGTATMWGTLPVALHQVVPTIGPATSTFFRFFIAALLLTPYLTPYTKINQWAQTAISQTTVHDPNRRTITHRQLWLLYTWPRKNHRRSHASYDSASAHATATS